ncbi:MAG TPA: DUF2971 domain-containing protein [Acidobacteriaceae bacterium]|nr:DUF2971 domain-containing protein [Acidobacteriaceae bacterium]
MDESRQGSVADITANPKMALDTLWDKGSEIIRASMIDPPSFVEPPHIYHYTTEMGLWGILKSGKLWLTDIFSLNDPSELEHGLNLANEKLDKKAEEDPAKYREIVKGFRTLHIREDHNLPRFFVCSFSKSGDDLGQWRGYAADGRGYAIGFKTTCLKARFGKRKSETSDGGEFLVEYQDDKLADIYGRLIDLVLAEVSTIGQNDPDYCSDLRKLYFRLVLNASVYFKHEAYCNEQEYRFLNIEMAPQSHSILKRVRNFELIDYKQFDWRSAGTDVLKKIAIGPAADFEKSKRFAEDCLRESSIDIASVEISQSKIPYKPA